ncbi:MAG TPA: nitroreductase family deazaflavin-dependent oxidoreductase [Rubrobacteraceae bacterium]|nr:nitroreductase family deazaflavin-dependent oxidoreductase [Rubrobacteraceae bacterium]
MDRSRSVRGWQKLYNPLVVWLLRSPLQGIMGGSTMLINYTGRKSGQRFTTPVNYTEDGDTLLIVSSRGHTWWKNLSGGAPVTVRVRGQDLGGLAEAFENEEARDGLLAVLRGVPAYRRHWKVELDTNGNPAEPEALSRVARDNVLVRVEKLVPLQEGANDGS